MQVTVDHWRTEPLCQLPALIHRVSHGYAAAGDDDREAGSGQQVGCLTQAVATARPTVQPRRLGDFHIDITVEKIARDIELGRPHL